jgi:hypothetical protein
MVDVVEVNSLQYRLVIHENTGPTPETMDGEVIMETSSIEAGCLMEAFIRFSLKPVFIGMVPDPRLPPDGPCGGHFSALSDEFPGKYWEIVGHLGD